MTRPERHNFAVLAGPPEPPVCGGDLGEVEAWRLAGLPFVVASARGGDPEDTVRLGLATPDKRRIGFRANVALLGPVGSPPSLAEAGALAPRAWAGTLARVAATCEAAGLDAFVFGSLAWTSRTGRSYLHDGSDLDLFLVPRPSGDRLRILDALDELVRPAADGPRIDGELRLADGAAANLRELVGRPAEVLVKGHGGARLVPLGDVSALVAGAAT